MAKETTCSGNGSGRITYMTNVLKFLIGLIVVPLLPFILGVILVGYILYIIAEGIYFLGEGVWDLLTGDKPQPQ